MAAISTGLDAPRPSSAPERISASSARLLTLRGSVRRQKSNRSRNGPSASRAATRLSTGPSPMPLIAPSPYTTSPRPFTVKRNSLVFTSGSTSGSFMWRHSSISTTTLSVLCISEDSTAAMNSAGKWRFSQAVWYDTSA